MTRRAPSSFWDHRSKLPDDPDDGPRRAYEYVFGYRLEAARELSELMVLDKNSHRGDTPSLDLVSPDVV